MITIRKEEEKDYPKVEEIIRKAFWNVYVPGCYEHYLAHIMRAHPDFLPEFDFVLTADDEPIGSIMYTKAKLTAEDGRQKDILTFGPFCILPEHQKKGYGKQLMKHSFAHAQAMGYDTIVIFGAPSNYIGQGFKSCKQYNICSENGTFPAAMLVKELIPGTLDGTKYIYSSSPVFNFDKQAAEHFDSGFKKMEKKKLPSQEEFYILSQAIIP